MFGLTYSDLLNQNRRLEKELTGRAYRIALLSNITVAPLKEILEYALRSYGVNAVVEVGNYDNIVQDSASFAEADAVVIFWEAANVIEGFHYRAGLLSEREFEDVLAKFRAELSIALRNLQRRPLVLVNAQSSLVFSDKSLRETALERFCRHANAVIREAAPANTVIVDIDKILAQQSIPGSVDLRLYTSSKALYTLGFFERYAEQVRPYFLSATGRAKKALVFDCDNTLWKGVLGEDGFDGIEMSSRTRDGRAFEEVQAIALQLQRQGVLLGICSKNNSEDVNRVLSGHLDMLLRSENFAGVRLNWNDKVTNLRALSKSWNIALDSIVFVDDSEFELDLVRRHLPEVTTIKVPAALHEYPGLITRHAGLFFQLSTSAEDAHKTLLYQKEVERQQAEESSTNLEDYVRSLELRIRVHSDARAIAPRIAQMTQKTNQFNLTTTRYTEADIARMIGDSRYLVTAISVADRFGDYGVTGLCIVVLSEDETTACIDTLLLSCRVLGRNVEFAFLNYLMKDLRQRGMKRVQALFLSTNKNIQVADFFDRAGFQLLESTQDRRLYEVNPNEFSPPDVAYIDVREDDAVDSAKELA